MAKSHRVAILGCGRTGKWHAGGYQGFDGCEVVGAADIDRSKAEALAEEFGFGGAAIHGDYAALLADRKPDFVSVCLHTPLHATAVEACVKAGVKGIHCEKPIAPTWGEAKRVVKLAADAGVQLTFNHQRRFLPSFRTARDLLYGGGFGELLRIEAFNPKNILDWGTHILDLAHMYNREQPARWVLGQIDAREIGKWFSVPFEFAAVGSVRFDNGVRAVIHSGDDKEMDVGMRLTAAGGVLELHGEQGLRTIRYEEGRWKDHEIPQEKDPTPSSVATAVRHVLSAFGAGGTPELCAARALRSTEVIFAIYESSRRRARIDLPLETQDSAFLTMLDEGAIGS